MTRILLAFLTLITLSMSAHAQLGGTDTKPGDACTAAEEGYVRRNASADRDISEITLICDGSQWQSATGGGGLAALQGQNDTGPCTVEKDGLIKYNASGNPKWEYCDGGTTSWLPFRLPQCLDNGAGECTLSLIRSNDDPSLIASNIRCGTNVLGVVGALGSGSASAFTFADVTGANISTLTTTSIVAIAGIPAGCPGEIQITGDGTPQYQICSNAGCSGVLVDWTAASNTIVNGNYLRARLTSASTYNTPHAATIKIGSTAENWSVTTRTQDTTPDAFTFTDLTAQNLSATIASNSVTMAGFDGPINVSVTGDGTPQISINGGAWVTSGTIANGQTLQVRTIASAAYNTLNTITVTVGTATDSWTVRTKVQDTTPDAFTFNDLAAQNLSAIIPSNSVTLAGFDGPLSVSVSGDGTPQISINGGAWGASGTINPGQTLQVRTTTSAAYNTLNTITVTAGAATDSWTVRTKVQDVTPDAFAFTDRTNVVRSAVATSNSVTLAGYDGPINVSVTGGGTPEISINGGAWVTSGTITNGQTLQVRLTASAAYLTTLTATITAGSSADSWTVQTEPNVTPGSQTYSAPGTYTFAVPNHNTLQVELWGAGGGGYNGMTMNQQAGGDAKWDGGAASGRPQAGGGKSPGTPNTNNGGVAGTASNCDTAATGGTGASFAQVYGSGSSSNIYAGGQGGGSGAGGGGTGGIYVMTEGAHGNKNGGVAGGGGAGTLGSAENEGSYDHWRYAGGGGGAYCKKSYNAGTYAAGTNITIVVPNGGAGANASGVVVAGTGANGRVTITWN